MVTRSNGTKKSNFSAQTTIPADATFDYVSNSTNYKITYANFQTSLGVSGTISAVGTGSTSILDDQGAVKGIRNIEDGAGIITVVDGNNSVSISTNFTYDATGEKLVDNGALAKPTFKSLVAGSGVGMSSTDDAITITSGGGQNVVIVNSLSDLPTPVASVISLAASTTYQISGAVNIGVNRLALGTYTAIVGNSPQSDVITSTNAGFLLTATNTFSINNVGFSAAGGWLSCTGSGTEEASISGVEVAACSVLAEITTWNFMTVFASHFEVATTDGFRFFGACVHASFDSNHFHSGVIGSQIDLGTATFDHFNIGVNNTFILASGITAITVAASSANINVGSSGHIFDNFMTLNSGTSTSGLTSLDDRWTVRNNNEILSSLIGAQGSCTGNATGTSATTTASVIALGTSFVDDATLNGNFTVTTGGRMTYDGLEKRFFFVDASIFAAATSGSAQQYLFYIAKNGTVITSSQSMREFTTSTPGSLEVKSLVSLNTGEYVEVYVKKVTGSDTMTVDTMSTSIYGV